MPLAYMFELVLNIDGWKEETITGNQGRLHRKLQGSLKVEKILTLGFKFDAFRYCCFYMLKTHDNVLHLFM